MLSLKIIIVSTREGRKGIPIANWIFDEAGKRKEFDTELIDLKKINLPFLDEPEHPRFKRYTKQTTKDWSTIIEPADAFIAVTPEYNYGYPAPLKNALDTVYQEWNKKAIGFVSYGGMAGGTRCVQMIKPVVLALNMIPVSESVNIPFFTKLIDEKEKFITNDALQKSSTKLFDELVYWGELLKESRQKVQLINH